eukprot:10382830-Karenia_brevis.AAC.1
MEDLHHLDYMDDHLHHLDYLDPTPGLPGWMTLPTWITWMKDLHHLDYMDGPVSYTHLRAHETLSDL